MDANDSRASRSPTAQGNDGATATPARNKLEGKWVKTIVFSRPTRCASHAATGYDAEFSACVAKKSGQSAASDGPQRTKTQTASIEIAIKTRPQHTRRHR